MGNLPVTSTVVVALHMGRAGLGLPERRALRNPATADPFYWAGFELVGAE